MNQFLELNLVRRATLPCQYTCTGSSSGKGGYVQATGTSFPQDFNSVTYYTLAWFRTEIEPQLSGFSLTYSYFREGDFGTLERVEFESEGLMGGFEFWSQQWLGIHVIDPVTVEEHLNLMLGPDQEPEKDQAVTAFLALL